KAYTTRVGSGPFPTEDGGAAGEAMRAVGREFGTTTGRARRCGWFDGVLLNYAVMVNGISSVVVTKLDVLSQFETVKICTEYRNGTSVYTSFPAHQSDFHHCEPVYEEMDGWSADISGVSRFEALPRQAQDFIKRIEGVGGAPVDLVSVGPDRRQTIVRRKVS
ncbi:MAG: adenylosuccinate synthetase, partial [Terriglobia bacterium]